MFGVLNIRGKGRLVKQGQRLLKPNSTPELLPLQAWKALAIPCMKLACWPCPQSAQSRCDIHCAGQLSISNWGFWNSSFLWIVRIYENVRSWGLGEEMMPRHTK